MKEKLSMVVSCPIDCYSGYSARSRDLVKALIATDRYDIKILSQRWGNTRQGFLEDEGEEELQSRVIYRMDYEPDVWCMITVPNEFVRKGKYNIGITAGMETDICHYSWVQGCNVMDKVFVSSEHAKSSLTKTVYDQRNESQQVIGQLKVNTPVLTLFEGVDLNKYKNEPTDRFNLSMVSESFAFLFIGHWMSGDFGQDRKNVGFLIKVFYESFKNKQNPPALILKTHKNGTSYLDREEMLKRIRGIRKTVKGRLPNIYLLHGDLSDSEIADLYNHPKVKSYVTFTKGEGFNRPLLEFSVAAKPIIATNWSGHLDFLSEENNILVGGAVTPVHPSAQSENTIIEGSSWYSVDSTQANKAMRAVFDNYKKFLPGAKKQAYRSRTEFSMEKMFEVVDELFATEVDPNIKHEPKIELPKLELPSLNLPSIS